MSKPFFFRIDLVELLDFATEPEGASMSLLQFAKELKRGQSDIPQIQKIIDETHEFIEKKKDAAHKRWNAPHMQNDAPHMQCNARSSNRSRSSIIKDEKHIGEQVPKQKVFTPPHPHEVQTYMAEIGFAGNGESFCDYYQARGWMIGKNKMKDWKAAVRTWRQNQPSRAAPNRPITFEEQRRLNNARSTAEFLAEMGALDAPIRDEKIRRGNGHGSCRDGPGNGQTDEKGLLGGAIFAEFETIRTGDA